MLLSLSRTTSPGVRSCTGLKYPFLSLATAVPSAVTIRRLNSSPLIYSVIVLPSGWRTVIGPVGAFTAIAVPAARRKKNMRQNERIFLNLPFVYYAKI